MAHKMLEQWGSWGQYWTFFFSFVGWYPWLHDRLFWFTIAHIETCSLIVRFNDTFIFMHLELHNATFYKTHVLDVVECRKLSLWRMTLTKFTWLTQTRMKRTGHNQYGSKVSIHTIILLHFNYYSIIWHIFVNS